MRAGGQPSPAAGQKTTYRPRSVSSLLIRLRAMASVCEWVCVRRGCKSEGLSVGRAGLCSRERVGVEELSGLEQGG